ncbi:MAG: hypothetical protein WCJ56_10580, partial [bacterium]
MPSIARSLCYLGALLLLGLFVGGCGGADRAGTNEPRGTVVFNITWPAQRLLPSASQSIVFNCLEVRDGGYTQLIKRVVVTRPASGFSTEQFTLPSVIVHIDITACPQSNGTGTPQASGQLEFPLAAGQTVTQTVTLDSTITSVKVTPNSATVNIGGAGTTLAATAYNADGALVLVAPTAWQWTPTTSVVISLSAGTGDSVSVAGLAVGTVTVTAKDSESGKANTSAITVVQPPPILLVTSVVASPDKQSIPIGQSQAFTAQAFDQFHQPMTVPADKWS